MSQVNQKIDDKQVLVPMDGDLGHGGLNPPDYSPGPDRKTTGWAPGYYNQAMVNTHPSVTHQSANNSTHSNNVVVVPGNSTTHTVTVEPPAKNYTALSVFNFLCCCLPLGLCALFYARDAQTMWLHGHTKEAQKKSRISRNLNIAGIVIGSLILIAWVTVVIVIIVFASYYRHDYYSYDYNYLNTPRPYPEFSNYP
ncbi:hypothetical protein Btru_031380 [Bulinus truncatus]|nr:hypothetical protein Btru_031380 [Bulinus truncatus]